MIIYSPLCHLYDFHYDANGTVLSIYSVCIPQKESHTGWEQHESKQMMAEFSYLGELLF